MARLLKGTALSKQLDEGTRAASEALRTRGITPTLAVVRMGERGDDISYENSIKARAGRCGVRVDCRVLPYTASQERLEAELRQLNEDESVHGVLILCPLPEQIDKTHITTVLAPEKDVDGITIHSLSGTFMGIRRGYPPCTAEAVVELLKHCDIPLSGQEVVVIGRSLTVGRPLAMLLLHEDATVTLCHTKTERLAEVCRRANILVTAAGAPALITRDHLNAEQVVVDVGIHVTDAGELVGDVDFDEAEQIVSAITPVIGGVGTVTTGLLFRHTVMAAEQLSAR